MAAQPQLKPEQEAASAPPPEPIANNAPLPAPPAAPSQWKAIAPSLREYVRADPTRAARFGAVLFFGLLATKCALQAWLLPQVQYPSEPLRISKAAEWNQLWKRTSGSLQADPNDFTYGGYALYKLKDRVWDEWKQGHPYDSDLGGIEYMASSEGHAATRRFENLYASEVKNYDAAMTAHYAPMQFGFAALLMYALSFAFLPGRWKVTIITAAGFANFAGIAVWLAWSILAGTGAAALSAAFAAFLIVVIVAFLSRRDKERRVEESSPTILAHSTYAPRTSDEISETEF